MDSRWAKVVFPEEDGPAMSTTRAPERTMRSAMSCMMRSCSASLTRMNSRKERLSTISFTSAAFSQPRMPL